MIVKSTEMQNNFGKYLEMAENQEIVITRNGQPVARLVGMNNAMQFLSDSLVGIIPTNIDENAMRDERLDRQ